MALNNDHLNKSQFLEKYETDSLLNHKKELGENDFEHLKSKPSPILSSSLPDFSNYKSVKQKKSAFFNFLMPLIQKENDTLLQQRKFIEEQFQLFKSDDTLRHEDIMLLKKYTLRYQCQNTDLNKAKTYEELLIKVDIIPQELALVQAALESAWGSSYFARLANNLFGQWCFKPGCGVIPRARKEGETHEVAKFKTLDLAIKSYMLLLNSHPAFISLRKERSLNRAQMKKPDALSMASGLKDYSARGEAYIHEIKSMIRTNKVFLTEPSREQSSSSVSEQE